MFSAIRSRQVKGQRGQGLTEYAIVLCLVAIAAIAAASLLGKSINTSLDQSTKALSATGSTKK